MINNKFTLLLRECRLNLNLTQKQVADALNIERSAYTYYETGLTNPTCDFVIRIAKIYNVNYSLFMDALSEDMYDSCDVLEFDVEFPKVEKISELSQEEQNLVLVYRVIPNKRKKSVFTYLSQLQIPNKIKTKRIKISENTGGEKNE